MQVERTGKPAKNPTRQEFVQHVMPQIKAAVEELLLKKHAKQFSADKSWLFSLDNDYKHNCAELLAAIGIMPGQRLVVPPYCSDLQKVIEHTHGALQTAFHQALDEDPNLKTMDQLKAKLHELFFTVITAQSVKKDVDSLPEMWAAIKADPAAGGTGGDWAPKHLR